MIQSKRKHILFLGLLLLVLLALVITNLSIGKINLSFNQSWDSLFNFDKSSIEQINFRIYRFPRVLMAILAGTALAISGLLVQTLFNNPLAGPYVLGINSGASLFVALSTMTGFTLFTSDFTLVSGALVGAFSFGLLILLCAYYVKGKISLLLVGIMLGSFTGAMVNVIQSYSNPDDLKAFTLWSFGSLQNTEFSQLWWISLLVLIGLVISVGLTKPLNLLILGEKQASQLGISVKSVRILIILSASLLTGIITAFCGPIAFIGLAVPNIAKLIFKTTNHLILIFGCLLIGSILLLSCDIIAQLCSDVVNIPLNAMTAIIGAPIVIWIIIKRF